MRAVTIVDGATEIVDMLDYRLQKSVETCFLCTCGAPATRLITVAEYGFGGKPAYGSFRSARCDKDGGPELINHPDFKGMTVKVEILGARHWLTYKDGVLQKESFGQ